MSKLPAGFVLDAVPLPPGFIIDEPDAVDTSEDVAKGLGIGGVKGLIGIADIPWMIEQGLNAGNKLLVDKGLAVPRKQSPMLAEPLSPTIQSGIETVTGPFYETKTKLGKAAEGVGGFLSSAITGPGGIARRVATQAVLPGVASEGAGYAFEGTPLETGARIAGAVVGGIGGTVAAGPKAKAAMTGKELKTAAKSSYQAAENAGVVIAQPSMRAAVDDITRTIAKEGVDKDLHPKSVAAWRRLNEAADQHVSLEGAEILRRVVSDATDTLEKSDRRIARIMLDKLDDYIEGLRPADVLAGDPRAATGALKQARDFWKKAARDEQIQKLVEKAQNRAGQFSQSGLENALRTEFRKLAQNDRAMRRFSPIEREAIQRVARGGGIENFSRWVGKLAPRGIVSAAGGAMLGGGAGSALAGDPYVGAGGAYAAGTLGHLAATALTKRNVRNASEIMRGATRLPPSTDRDALFSALKALYLQQQPQFAQ